MIGYKTNSVSLFRFHHFLEARCYDNKIDKKQFLRVCFSGVSMQPYLEEEEALNASLILGLV